MNNSELKKTDKLPRIRDLQFSPEHNPLLEPGAVQVKRRYVQTASRRDIVEAGTGEVHAVAAIHVVEEKDDAEFVKVFADGVRAAFDLSKTASRVFQHVLDVYQNTPMTGGFADCIYLVWFDGGLSGRDIGMSEATFNRGLRELLTKKFLAPRTPSVYWVNPSLFFKGDRVKFVKEYRRRRSNADQAQRDALEEAGQQRIEI